MHGYICIHTCISHCLNPNPETLNWAAPLITEFDWDLDEVEDFVNEKRDDHELDPQQVNKKTKFRIKVLKFVNQIVTKP
jgi:hypothetical protein